MNYFAECLAIFRTLPEDEKEAYGGVETYAIIKELEGQYKIKLSFLVILLAIGEIEEEDISEYLIIKFKISPETAQKVKEDIVNKIIDPAIEKIIPEDDDSIGVASREDIINIFSRRIVESLKASPEVVAGLNINIFQALNTYDDLEEKVINILYNNDEVLTREHLRLDNREVSPTISNWLKDFIKENGSEIFDELVLAQYLSTSQNTKKLSPDEKNLVRRVLKLYRNLTFFPESMENLAITDWQIIPTDKSVDGTREVRDVLDDDNQETKKVVAKAKPAKTINAKISNPSKMQDKEIKNSDLKKGETSLAELQQALALYMPGTLEYKAVVQEIERLKKKK
ncbi:MAG: hypothetical protein WCN88_04050 [Candidatus Falkowbacteria bacterium]